MANRVPINVRVNERTRDRLAATAETKGISQGRLIDWLVAGMWFGWQRDYMDRLLDEMGDETGDDIERGEG